jgi:hypothetical protein
MLDAGKRRAHCEAQDAGPHGCAREWYRYNAGLLRKSDAMEAEHVNAIGTAIAGLKDRTAQLRRYL